MSLNLFRNALQKGNSNSIDKNPDKKGLDFIRFNSNTESNCKSNLDLDYNEFIKSLDLEEENEGCAPQVFVREGTEEVEICNTPTNIVNLIPNNEKCCLENLVILNLLKNNIC